MEEIKALRNEAMTRDAKEREQALVSIRGKTFYLALICPYKLRRELQKTNSELEDELRRIKNIVASDYVPKTDADEFKKDIEAEVRITERLCLCQTRPDQARMELNRRLEELNTHLAEQVKTETFIVF